MVDSFGSNDGSAMPNIPIAPPIVPLVPVPMQSLTPFQLPIGPNLTPANVFPSEPDTQKLWAKVEADVDNFRASLPNDIPSLISKFKELLKQRIDTWEKEPNPYDRERWDEYCQAILDKLPKYSSESRCVEAWIDVYNLAYALYSGDPEQKTTARKAYAKAEKICQNIMSNSKPPSTTQKSGATNDSMPPIAPPRQQPTDNIFNPIQKPLINAG